MSARDSDDAHLAVLATPRLLLTVPPTAHAPQLLSFAERNREHMAPWAPPARDPVETVETWRRRLGASAKLTD